MIMQKETPILFSTDMICAILNDYKIVTRRVAKTDKCKYNNGDWLWVKETYTLIDNQVFFKSTFNQDFNKWYPEKVGIIPKWKSALFMPKRYAGIWLEVKDVRKERLHDITDDDAVKEGIKLIDFKCDGRGWENYMWYSHCGNINQERIKSIRKLWPWQYSTYKSPRDSFSSLWEKINAKRGLGWDTNPFVWRVEFERIK